MMQNSILAELSIDLAGELMTFSGRVLRWWWVCVCVSVCRQGWAGCCRVRRDTSRHTRPAERVQWLTESYEGGKPEPCRRPQQDTACQLVELFL